MLEHLVRTTLGICRVTLQREGMALEERGGFTARWVDGWVEGRAEGWAEGWAEAEGDVLGLDDYRRVVKAYLADLYKHQHGRDPGGVTLNLASHQLLDDLSGWAKLNWRPA